MLKALEVAYAFIKLQDENNGDNITNLKVQKLLYYAQALSLVINNRPLFLEKIEAWTYGPVVPAVYDEFSVFKKCALEIPDKYYDWEVDDEDDKNIIEITHRELGQYSAWKLAEMTHNEDPWRNAYNRGVKSIIDDKSLLDYFKDKVE